MVAADCARARQSGVAMLYSKLTVSYPAASLSVVLAFTWVQKALLTHESHNLR